MDYIVKPSILSGEIKVSPSKSHTLRAILFASMANKRSCFTNYLKSPDTKAMINACRMIGANIIEADEKITIDGVRGKPKTPNNVIDVGNSGLVLRLFGAISALCSGYVVLTGDESIRYNRPIQPLIDGLTQLGAFCVATKEDGYAPVIIKGPIHAGKITIDGGDSQPVSGLLIVSAFLDGVTEIFVNNPGEKPFIDMTLDYLNAIGVKYRRNGYEHYIVYGKMDHDNFNSFSLDIPGDFSSLLFPVVAALITQSEITLQHVDMGDVQGDKKVINILKSMGANIEYNAAKQTLKINKTKQLVGCEIDVNDFIDAVPILAVVGCHAIGQTKLVNAAIARTKECDRLAAITTELKKMGAQIKELPDGLIIESSKLQGTKVQTYHDHRMVMALTAAALGARGETIVEDIKSVAKSYPSFYEDMKKLGTEINQKS